MNRHLVTVEVGVERCTYERVKLDCLTFYKNRLECLDTKSVQCRGTVQHNRMLFNDIFQYIPDFCLKSFHHFLCVFDIVCCTVCNKLFHYERFEQLDCHFFRQTALIDLQFRSYYDNGTSGIVNTFSEQVLTETSGLSF